jgi:predicted metalloprotease with PDZ domain
VLYVGNERGVLVAEEVDACGTLGRAGVAEGDLVLALNSVRLSKVCMKKIKIKIKKNTEIYNSVILEMV